MKMPFKRIGWVGICLLLFSAVVSAESLYVTDVLKLTLRTGPSTEHRILAVVESGLQVEVLGAENDWSLVRLPNGKEGYVLTRYLTPDPPHSVRLEQLQIKHKTLMQQAATLLEENTRLKEENNRLKTTLGSNEKTLKQLSDDYQNLKAGSAEYLSLKANFKKISTQLVEQTQRAEKLDEQLSRVEMNQYIKWFFAGSGVLLLGFIIGFSARRQRRRPSLL